MSSPRRCVACQMVESEAFAASSTVSFLSLAPCGHTMCSDCYANPCTLVQCYGCPACGAIPTGTTTLSSAAVMEKKKEQEEIMGEQQAESFTPSTSTFDCTTTLDSLYYTGVSSSSYYHYPTTTTAATSYSSYSYFESEQEQQDKKGEEECKMVEMTSSDIHEYVSTHGLTDLSSNCYTTTSYPASSCCSESAAEQGEETTDAVAELKETKEEEEEEEVSVTPSETSVSTIKKRRRQKKAGKGPVSRWEGQNAKPSKAPTVIVPKNCPDHLRPKRKPAPTTCREHGRRLEREETLRKIRRGKDEDMRKMRKIGRDMSCF